ncbi:prepilin-type N-terminal cleavage/methylation domain-containing protein, partial [Acinetobacter baumannii]|uniref:prepilin-type N-terminal cleavage/methylation domain-containing protein n=1 Tax=Acinetobacter baumannii TaxID=470 RepID=UPI0039B5D924
MHYPVRQSSRGFTVVEILIVIVVIGILAGITIVTYGGVQRRAASVSAQDAAKDAAEMVDVEKAMGRTLPASLPATFKA